MIILRKHLKKLKSMVSATKTEVKNTHFDRISDILYQINENFKLLINSQEAQQRSVLAKIIENQQDILRYIIPYGENAGYGDKEFELKEYQHITSTRTQNIIRVTQPLVLISQIPRSGGTLLSQLFDKHPQCYVYPYEFYRSQWPIVDLENPHEWFRKLTRKYLYFFWNGFKKYGVGTCDNPDIHPFLLPPLLQEAIFNECLGATKLRSQRDLHNCYMTSVFNAWLDNQSLYTDMPKKYVVAFSPRLSMKIENTERFFEVYPDGKLICIIRDPKSWYASARKHNKSKYAEITKAIELWNLSTKAILEAKERFDERVYILTFQDLIRSTEATMHSLAKFLAIDFMPTLLNPTFNGLPIKANSSYPVKDYGLIKEPVKRHKELKAQEIAYIEKYASGLYEQVIVSKAQLRVPAQTGHPFRIETAIHSGATG